METTYKLNVIFVAYMCSPSLFVHPSVRLTVCLSVCLVCKSICLCPSVRLTVCLSVCLVCKSIWLCPSVCLSVRLLVSVCLSVCVCLLSVRPLPVWRVQSEQEGLKIISWVHIKIITIIILCYLWFYIPVFGKVRPHFHNVQAQPFFYVRKSRCQLIKERFRYALKRCAEHKRNVHAMHGSKPLRKRRIDCQVIEHINKWRSSFLSVEKKRTQFYSLYLLGG